MQRLSQNKATKSCGYSLFKTPPFPVIFLYVVSTYKVLIKNRDFSLHFKSMQPRGPNCFYRSGFCLHTHDTRNATVFVSSHILDNLCLLYPYLNVP